MGGGACQIIIIGGNQAYGVIEQFSEDHSQIETAKLESAVRASCQAIEHASLYFVIEDEEKLTRDYTDPIINLHDRIIFELPKANKKDAQILVDNLTRDLFAATRKTVELFE